MAKKEKEIKGPQYMTSPLNNQMINYAEYYMSAAEKIFSFIAVFVIGGLAGMVFYGGLFKSDGEATIATYISNVVVFAVVGLVAVKFFVPAINEILKKRRAKALRKQFMDFLEALATSLSAGDTVHGAVVNAKKDMLNQYSEKDLMIVELSEIISGTENGETLEVMLQSFGSRSANEDILNFSNVISNCYRLGGNFGDVVRKTREVISDKISVEDEIETKISSNKMQLNAMSLMPVVLVGMLKMSSTDFANNLTSFLGVVVTTISIAIFVAAYLWGRKIIDVR